MRKVILHYHLFKNAGTSIDNILKDSFSDKWLNWDRPLNKLSAIYPFDMARFIEENPHLTAISSHDVLPPLPKGDFELYPIVFLRHPIVRARSAYMFEWQKELGLDSPKGSFSDYIDEKLPDNPKWSSVISNFQVSKLSNVVYGEEVSRKALRDYEKLERAKFFLSGIPYFGLVENFQQSLIRLHYYLKAAFPEIKVVKFQANVTQDIKVELGEKLESIKVELGEEKYQLLCGRNALDLELYEFAVDEFYSVVQPR